MAQTAQQLSEIKASARPRSGSGGARATRREKRVPGVVYGSPGAPQTVALDANDLSIIISRGRFLSTIFELNVDGSKMRVIPREVQLDPVRDMPIHVDFQRVSPGSRIRVNVPVRFINEALSPGLKRGGVLNIVRHEVEVTCPADAIPDFFEFNLEGLDIGRSVHISAVKLPEGVKPTILNRDFTVATIAGHKLEEEPTTTAEAAATAEGAAPEEGAAPAEGAAAAAPADAKAAAAGAKAPAGKEAAAGAKPAAAAKPAEKGKK